MRLPQQVAVPTSADELWLPFEDYEWTSETWLTFRRAAEKLASECTRAGGNKWTDAPAGTNEPYDRADFDERYGLFDRQWSQRHGPADKPEVLDYRSYGYNPSEGEGECATKADAALEVAGDGLGGVLDKIANFRHQAYEQSKRDPAVLEVPPVGVG